MDERQLRQTLRKEQVRLAQIRFEKIVLDRLIVMVEREPGRWVGCWR